jgi:hypothetical protein
VKNLKSYIYKSNSGKNSFVYYIEGGVAFEKQSNARPALSFQGKRYTERMAKLP